MKAHDVINTSDEKASRTREAYATFQTDQRHRQRVAGLIRLRDVVLAEARAVVTMFPDEEQSDDHTRFSLALLHIDSPTGQGRSEQLDNPNQASAFVVVAVHKFGGPGRLDRVTLNYYRSMPEISDPAFPAVVHLRTGDTEIAAISVGMESTPTATDQDAGWAPSMQPDRFNQQELTWKGRLEEMQRVIQSHLPQLGD